MKTLTTEQLRAKFPLVARPDIARTAIAWNDVIGFLLPAELGILYRTALNAPSGCVFLEIGSFYGLSSTIMATGFQDAGNESAQLHCVDLWGDYYGASKDKFLANCERLGVMKWIQAHQESSHDLHQRFQPGSVDLAFIDGDHSYEGCLSDLKSVHPLVRKGGKIIGHDFASYSVPVMNAVRDFINKTPGVVFDAPEPGSSIFTLWVN